jgi:hypothetical protein
MKKLLLIIAIATLSGCYEYRKLPNVKRVKKSDIRKAMKHSTSSYEMPRQSTYNVSYHYNN